MPRGMLSLSDFLRAVSLLSVSFLRRIVFVVIEFSGKIVLCLTLF